MYSCTIKTTEVASRKSGNRQDTGFAANEAKIRNDPQEKIERNDRKLHTPTTIRYKNDATIHQNDDVAGNTSDTTGILIQPVI